MAAIQEVEGPVRRNGATIIGVCTFATLFLSFIVPSFAQKPAGDAKQQPPKGSLTAPPKGIIKQDLKRITTTPQQQGVKVPGIPSKNVIQGSVTSGNFQLGPHSAFSTDPLRQRQKGGDVTRGGPPQDRDATQTQADCLQPRFAQGDTRIWLATNATGKNAEGRLSYDGIGVAYHIWSVDTDGKSATQKTGNDSRVPRETTGEQQYPDVNQAANVLAYAHRNTPGSGGFSVYVRFLSSNGLPILVSFDPSFPFTDAIHPSLSPSGTELVFSGKRSNDTVYKLYKARIDGSVYPDGKFVVQLTDGAAGTADDLSPDWSPDGTRIVFTRRDGSGGERLFMSQVGGPVLQYTNFAVSGNNSKDRDANWRSDGARLQFASTRKSRSAGKLQFRQPANEVGTSYDIYEMNSAIEENTTINRPRSLTADPMDGTGQGATDPTEAFNRNMFAYVSDRPFSPINDGNHDIWIGLFEDITPPLLEEIPKVYFNGIETREGLPNQTVTLLAHVTDLQTGVAKVYAQFKDPDGSEFDSEGVEHRLYYELRGDIPNPFGQRAYPQTGSKMDLFIELGQEVINPYTFGYSFPWVLFVGPVGDADLRDGLPMWDDGPISGGGHEPEGQVLGDDFYTATWTTPFQPSDFYFDVMVEDDAGNQLIYDNIGGFTTKLFSAQNPILFVADYIAGQLFVQDLNFNPLLGQLFARTTWAPVESYWTRNPASHGVHAVFYSPAGVPAYSYWPFATGSPRERAGETLDTLGPTAIYQECDIWRTQCRNPITLAVLSQYLPRIDQQVDPSNPLQTRGVQVAERAVVWANPYTKDLFTARLGIDTTEIRSSVQQYIDAGGRMVLSGQDIAWGLTQNGQVQNDLLTSYFRVQFVDDVGPDVGQVVYQANRHSLLQDSDVVSTGPWDFHWARPDGELDELTQNYLADPAQLTKTPFGLQLTVPGTAVTGAFIGIDGAWNQLWIDSVSVAGTVLYPTLWNPYRYSTGGFASVANRDGGRNTKTMFMAFGMEGIHSAHRIVSTPIGDFAWSDSRRYEILHGALCWMRTARAYGKVESIDPQTQEKKPEEGVLVRFTAGNGKDPDTIGQVLGAALTDSNGEYTIIGLPPGHYFVDAVKPGFRIQHPEAIRGIHGGQIDRQTTLDLNVIDLIITKEPPGSVLGRVVNDNGDPVQNVVVTITPVFPSIPASQVLTDDTGTFRATLGAGDYVVTVDATSVGYGGTSQPTSVDVTITSGLNTVIDTGNPTPPGKDAFIVFGITGNLKGKVTASDTGNPIQGAQIVVKITRFNQVVTYGPVVTDSNGDYDFAANGIDLPPSSPQTYQMIVSAFGYKTRNDINPAIPIGTTITQDVVMTPVSPRTLRGWINTKLSGSTVEDAPAGIKVIVKLNGIEVGNTLTFHPSVVASGSRYNYEFAPPAFKLGDNINQYEISVDTTGFGLKAPAPILVSVPDGDTPLDGKPKYAPDITLLPLHTFAKFNSLVSFPYSYANTDPKVLLNGGASFRFAAWDENAKLFRNYPAPPANDVRLGRGYFLKNDLNMALTTPGIAADTGTLFPITLKKGWNLIGNPFPFEIRLESSLVQGPSGFSSYADAVRAGWVSPALWSVESGVAVVRFSLLDWFGYWVLANEDVTLFIDPAGQPFMSSGANLPKFADLMNPADGWRLNLQASTDRGVSDTAAFLGVSPTATEGFDNRYDLRRPPSTEDEYVTVVFTHGDWGNNSGNYASDVRGIAATGQSWKVSVECSQPGANVTLRWPSMATMPKTINLVLIDEATGKRQFMRSTSSFSFKADEAGSRSFRVEQIGQGRILRITNPVAQSTRGGTSVSFSLSSEASVQVNVLGPGGKLVRQVTNSVTAKAGAQSVTWDGRDAQGIALPPGAYTIEVRATTEDGQIARVVTPVILKR